VTKTFLEAETVHPTGGARGATQARLLTLTVAHHPDPERVGERVRLPLLSLAHLRIAIGRGEPAFRSAAHASATPLLTPFVSRKPLWLEGLGDDGVRVDARESGSKIEIDGRPVTGTLDLDAQAIERGVVLQLGSHVVLVLHIERDLPFSAGPLDTQLIGQSEPILEVKAAIARVAQDRAAVLVRGETGSGKEVVAAAIHHASQRKDRPFVAVNMAAIASSLAASELFGHVRGAFSGADQNHDGLFVRAHGGTLFMDEVGDTPNDVQATLLRVLETGEVLPVGGRAPKSVDVRVVAATDADLDRSIADGRFRGPLFYRLAANEIRVPPLRERRADIGRLVVFFLKRELATLGREVLMRAPEGDGTPWLRARLVARLVRYDWPGNVRQLKSLCHAIALGSATAEGVADAELERLMPSRAPTTPGVQRPYADLPEPVVKVDARATIETEVAVAPKRPARAPASIGHDELEQVLASYDFRLSLAADHFGISRPTMNELVDKHPRLKRAQRLSLAEIERGLADAKTHNEPVWRLLGVSERGLKQRMKELGLQ
jgi:two-component system nitrogen regulation response regulator GlnG